jgi:hypothetical protein
MFKILREREREGERDSFACKNKKENLIYYSY